MSLVDPSLLCLLQQVHQFCLVSTLRLLTADWLWGKITQGVSWTLDGWLRPHCAAAHHVFIWWWGRLPGGDEVALSDQSGMSHQKMREQSDTGLVGGWLCWEPSSCFWFLLSKLRGSAISWQPVMGKWGVTGFPLNSALTKRHRLANFLANTFISPGPSLVQSILHLQERPGGLLCY